LYGTGQLILRKTILITGAGGYIGRHVLAALLRHDVRVIACDIKTEGIDPRAEILNADIFSGNKDIFKELGTPDVCIHMAWRDGFIHNADTHMEDLSRHYTFIKNMITGGLRQIAVMGTMHEVGYHEGAITENTACSPVSMYGIAKDALRRGTALLVKDKDVVWQWLRAYYIYGDDRRNNSIFAKIIAAEEEGRDFFPFTTGRNQYDFIEVSALARQIAAAAAQDKVCGIINCCSGKPVSLAEKAEGFIREHGYKIKLQYGAFPDREYDSPAVWGDNSRIKEIEGISANVRNI
jgi:dTDP-6-deoxy-L-talose 4-dehydrogenase (NAD+)